MNQAEFAARHDVSRKTVTQWKKRGWLVFQGDLVDVKASDELIAKYRRDGATPIDAAVTSHVTHAEGNNAGNTPGNNEGNATPAVEISIGEEETAAQAAERIVLAAGADMSMDEARRVKENYLALLNQLEYDQKSGLVVMVSEVAALVGADYAKVRTRLLAIPAERAPQIHRCRTVTEVQDALQELITAALEDLTHDGDVR
ncbi:hypothetical protein DDE05_00530 [Streptomyces cavourensis]|nr:hypothetical protein DDE05_00530 [Streptomyces cavourensis]